MRLLLPLLLVPLLFACEDNAPEVVQISTSVGLNLRTVVGGNHATYVLYQSGCQGGFTYTGDTLMVSIIGRNDSTFIQETYTLGSLREGTVEHLINQKEDYVLIPERFNSEMLFFYGNDTIFLDRTPEVELRQIGCKLYHDNEEFVGDFIGSLDRFQFGDFSIENRKGVSCIPTIFDLDAYIIYGDHLNMVHVIQDNGEAENIFGFLAIE